MANKSHKIEFTLTGESAAQYKEMIMGINWFKVAYYRYGYLPTLLVLEHCVDNEFYTTAAHIRAALAAATKGEEIPLIYGADAIAATRKDFAQRGWGERLNEYLKNVPAYASECQKYLEDNVENFKN